MIKQGLYVQDAQNKLNDLQTNFEEKLKVLNLDEKDNKYIEKEMKKVGFIFIKIKYILILK